MQGPDARTHPSKPPLWQVLLALTWVYLSWGTTYLAIREGVKTLPPGLFGGLRIAAAGAVLLAWLALRGQPVRLPWRELGATWLIGGLLFVGGNGLVTLALKTVPSGVGSVLVATTPLWMALLEAATPRGERLAARGWVGLLLGLGGVALLWAGRAQGPAAVVGLGPLLLLGSALAWSVGSFLHRHRRSPTPLLLSAAWQSLLGGGSLALVGVAAGEAGGLSAAQLTPRALAAFFYLLTVSSLFAFVAYLWLLRNVSAALAGTYAYVNPAVAVLLGWLLADEALSPALVGGLTVILAGVALVRASAVRPLPGPDKGKGLPCPERSFTLKRGPNKGPRHLFSVEEPQP
jgi:drug/metabolite transporter (DMT)-like permease